MIAVAVFVVPESPCGSNSCGGCEMTSFFAFMASAAGRISRIAAGVVLIVVGVLLGGGWWALEVVGLVPLAAGILDVCVFAPLFRRPFNGARLRAATAGSAVG